MNIGIITYGTRGDVQPYLSLALGLSAKGHKVTLAGPENFKEFVEKYGIDFHPIHANVEQLMYTPEALRILKTGNPLTLVLYIQKAGKPLLPVLTRDIMDVCSRVDVMIAGALTFMWVHSIAEKQNKRWAFFQLGPIVTPTKHFPFIGFSFFDNHTYNLLSHKVFNLVHWMINREAINTFRASLGLGKLKESIFKRIEKDRILNLYGLSPNLIPRPDDWGSHNNITGFLSLSGDGNTFIPDDISTWINKGEPPIYIGFGSIPVPDPDRFCKILNEFISVSGLRIVFCKGWSVLENLPDHPNLLVLESIDHKWLFPRCKAVVFHGGIGTLAACLMANVPPIIVSVFGDQPWNGRLVENKKLGIHIPFRKLTSSRLIDAVASVEKTGIRNNIAAISGKMNKEKGLEKAVTEIEQYFIEKKFL